MLIQLITFVFVAQIPVSTDNCLTDEFLSTILVNTNITSFNGKYKMTYTDYAKNKSGMETHEYRFSGKNAYQSIKKDELDAEGDLEFHTQAFFNGQVTMSFGSEGVDGKVLSQVVMDPEFNIGLGGGWVTSWGLDPQRIMGSIGRNAGSSHMDVFGVSLVEFLKTPGPIQCFERPPFLIVSHKAKVGMSEVSADVWFDTTSNMDVARIDEVVRPYDIAPETIQKLYAGDPADLRVVKKSLEMFGHMDVGGGVRVPTEATVKNYVPNPADDSIVEQLNAEGHTREELAVLLAMQLNYLLESEASMQLLLDECSFNIPLTDDKFRVDVEEGAAVFKDVNNPSQYETVVTKAWYQRTGLIVPLIILFLAVPVLVFIGRRHLGWKW